MKETKRQIKNKNKPEKEFGFEQSVKPDCQSQNVNHNTKKVSLGPNTNR